MKIIFDKTELNWNALVESTDSDNNQFKIKRGEVFAYDDLML